MNILNSFYLLIDNLLSKHPKSKYILIPLALLQLLSIWPVDKVLFTLVPVLLIHLAPKLMPLTIYISSIIFMIYQTHIHQPLIKKTPVFYIGNSPIITKVLLVCAALIFHYFHLVLLRKIKAQYAIFIYLVYLLLFIAVLRIPMIQSQYSSFLITLYTLILSTTWFFLYALLPKSKTENFFLKIFSWKPFWGGGAVPFPNNSIKLLKSFTLSSSLLVAGFRLITWGIILFYLNIYIIDFKNQFITTYSYKEVFVNTIKNLPYIWYENFIVLFFSFLTTSLLFFSWGHIIVGIIKLSGFNVANNTQKPFLATNIADFFNRYYFYFKELLVDIFFYPSFFNLNFLPFKIKLLVSTFMAAGVGNFLYHYFKFPLKILKLGVFESIYHTSSFALYASILTLGIYLSQVLKENGKAPSTNPLIIWLKRLGVWIFFLLLHPLYYSYHGYYSLNQHFKFFFSLFNLV